MGKPEPESVDISGDGVSGGEATITKGDTLQLKATVKPPAASQEVDWSSSNTNVAPVDTSGKVTGAGSGNSTITATTKKGRKRATSTVKVTVQEATVPVTGVSLDKTTLTLDVGQSQKLTATVQPNNATDKTVSWKSSDDAVSTVDASGNVKGIKAGTATITVTTKDGNKTATCSVTVNTPVVPVDSVTVSPKTADVDVGKTQQLTASVKPDNATDKSVTWKSSSDATATVDGTGKVTAVKEGSATITVTTKDGNKTDTSVITVKVPVVPVTGVTIDPKTASIEVGKTQQLTPTITPSNATNKNVTYKSSDESKATVDAKGLVTGVAAGESTVTVTTADGNKTDTSVITVTEPAVLSRKKRS